MTIQSWQSIIDLIRNGDPVSADVANRAVDQLRKRTDHLKARQDSQDLAQAIYISDAPLASGVSTGHAVYFDAISEKFAAAYADIEFKDGVLQPTPSSSVVGIVIYKDTANSGVIVVSGWINPDNYDDFDCDQIPMLTNMLTNSSNRGILYLASGATHAGRLVPKPGILSIPVCNLVSTKHLLVRPPVTSVINTQALKFKLSNDIAGYGLVLRKGDGNTAAAFDPAPAIGAQVKLYLSQAGTSHPNDETTLYLTGTVANLSDPIGDKFRRIHLTNLEMTKELIQAIKAANGNYNTVFTPIANHSLKIKVIGTSTTFTISQNSYPSYVSPVTYNTTNGWTINTAVIDNTKPGWLPASDSAFTNSIKPDDAKFGYNVSKDPVLQQLFPEGMVTAYMVMKDGIAVSDSVVEVNESGIWWKDSILQAPWHTVGTLSLIPEVKIDLSEWAADETDEIVVPSELYLAYVKLVTGGAKLVTSLDTPADSPIIITDPFGNVANSGPLTIKAGFDITEATTSEPGSLVIKKFSGFKAHRGRVVERVRAGANIEIASSFPDGQGELTVAVTGLDGRLEGQPDILAVDDVLIERDASYNIFYSVFPPSKASSILGKIDIPTYLADNTYKVELDMTFLAMHAITSNIALPALSLTWTTLPGILPNSNTKVSLSAAGVSPQAQSVLPYSGELAGRDCVKKSVVLVENAARGSSVFFKLARGGDSYASKIGLISISYRFVK